MIAESPFRTILGPHWPTSTIDQRERLVGRNDGMIHRPDGSFALYLVNWEMRSAGNFQPSLVSIPELTLPQVITAFTSPQPEDRGSRFLDRLEE
jgi:hypothetical protein